MYTFEDDDDLLAFALVWIIVLVAAAAYGAPQVDPELRAVLIAAVLGMGILMVQGLLARWIDPRR